MSKWIDIDDISLLKTVSVGGLSAKALWKRIRQQPSIDLVRCEECKWYDETAMSNVRCRCVDKGKHMKGLVENYADDFCSYGERKENE